MASEIRVNRLSNRSGLSTITFANGGVQFSGITTFANGDFRVGTGATILNPSANEMQFHTGGSNRLTINNSGVNLGTGNITAVDGTFTGNVSIAKTLTYEDVKNVDSVGVVTARTGVKITGGDFTVGTAITASSVTGNVTQDVGITTFSGSATWFKGTTANKDMYWSKSSGSLIFKDTAAALFGDSSDLQISHDGSNSYIKDSGTGGLRLCADEFNVKNAANNEVIIRGTQDSGVELYYDNSKKLESTSTGVTVTGVIKLNQSQSKINLDTSDGSDNKFLSINGGGDASQSRGAGITWYGNEVSSHEGRLQILAGNSGSANGVVQFHTGGAERMRITSGGELCIGTVTGTGNNLTVQDAGTSTTAGGNIVARFQTNGAGRDATIQLSDNVSHSATISMLSSALIVKQAGAETVRIKSNGYVGINETNPSYQVDVKGDSGIYVSAASNSTAAQLTISGRNSSGSGSALSRLKSYPDGSSTQAHFAIETRNSSASMVERLRITSNGNIGLGGVTSPLWTTGGGMHLNDAYGIGFGNGGSGRPDFQIACVDGSKLEFRCGFGADTADIVMNTSGYFGVGTATPDGLLHVYGGDSGGSSSVANGITIENNGLATLQFLSPNDTGNQIRFGDNGDNGAGWIQYVHTDNHLDIGCNGSEKMRITNGGDVIIGSNTWAYPKRLNVRDTSGSTISLSSEDNQTGNANTGPGIEFLLYNGSSTTASAELRAWQESSTSGNASSYLKFMINPNGSMLEAYKINSRGNVIFGGHSNWFNDDAVTQGEGAWRIQLKGGSGSGGSNPPSEMGYLLIDADGGHNSATMNYGIKCYDAYQNVSGHVCAGYFSTKHKWSSHTKHWGVVGRGVNRGPSSSSGGRGHSGFSGVLAPVGVMGVIENSDNVGGTVSESVAVMAINDATKGGENIGVAIHTKAGANNVYGLMYTHGGSNSPKVYFKTDGGIANYSGNNSNLSDESQKKDIVDAPSTWNQVKNWKIRNFRMNEDSSSVPLKFGVIAQEIKTVTPNIVSVFQPAKAGIAATTISEPGPNGETGPDWMVNVPEQPEQPELLGVCDQQVDWMVAKALQEAMAKIEVLEAKVAALESS